METISFLRPSRFYAGLAGVHVKPHDVVVRQRLYHVAGVRSPRGMAVEERGQWPSDCASTRAGEKRFATRLSKRCIGEKKRFATSSRQEGRRPTVPIVEARTNFLPSTMVSFAVELSNVLSMSFRCRRWRPSMKMGAPCCTLGPPAGTLDTPRRSVRQSPRRSRWVSGFPGTCRSCA